MSKFRSFIFPRWLFVIFFSIVCFTIAIIPLTIVSGFSLKSFWTKGDDMPTPRGEHGAAIVDDKIYVIGGRERPGFKARAVLGPV